MKKRTLFWRLFSSFLAVGCISLFAYFLIVLVYIYNSRLTTPLAKTEIYGFFARNLAFTSLIMMFVTGFVSFFLSKKIAKPIEVLEKKTQEGLDSLSSEPLIFRDFQTEEVSRLAQLIGDLHAHLNNRIAKVTTQKNEQEAIFMSLSEGVLAISGSGKVKRMNTAAKNIFGLTESFQKDAAFVELIRIPQLIDFVKSALEKKEPSETSIEIFEPDYQALKVTAAPYMNAGNDRLGVVLVLSNITEIKTLEKHRSEFVANVSHELRTPLTSIQGYAETLLHPKLLDSPEKVHEFAEKIRDNSIRLKNMVDDMLFLANVEQNKERREKRFTEHNLSFLLNKALEFLKAKAQSEQMELNLFVEEDFKVKVNEGMMVQVFVNLIDNAIKYSAGAKRVDIQVLKDGNAHKLEVRDYGEGISEEHIPRLFERFYRVDKDRSRKKGGSGLGLSIVKNILSLHHLEIFVDSIVGEGTSFTILFPEQRFSGEEIANTGVDV